MEIDQDALFREHVLIYLTKLEVEIQALHLALEKEEPPISTKQMDSYRAQIGGKADQVGQQIRREFETPVQSE